MLTHDLPKFELDENTKRLERLLDDKSEVVVHGNVPNPFQRSIKVNFLHASIESQMECLF